MAQLRLNPLAFVLAATFALAGCGVPALMAGSGDRSATVADDRELLQQDSPTEEFKVPLNAMAEPQPWVDNSSAALSVGPTENVAAIKDLIQNSKKTLFIEVFNFANDSFGQQIAPLVIDAAKRGVKVKFLADYIGSRFVGGKTLGNQMQAAGVDFRFWKPRFIVQDDKRRGINITHRKVYCADGDRALTGGVNLMAPFDTTTHDLLVDFHGAEAAQLHSEFARDWVMSKGQPVQYDPLPAGVHYGSVRTETLVTSPPEGRFEARSAIYHAIENAQHTITVENQYLWDQELMDRILAAAKRGVAVRVIVPGKSDNKVFKHLHAVALNAILKAGGEARLYNGNPDTAHVHTKYFCVDDQWACFGSVNGDTRALMDNQELDVATTDGGLLSALKNRVFETDWNTASKVYHFNESPFYEGSFTKLWQVLDYYM